MKPKVVHFAVFFLSTIIAAAVFAPAIEAALGGNGEFMLSSRLVLSRFCHQDPGRSFFLFGAPLSVCARCTGIYLGFWLAWIGWRYFPPRLRDRAIGNLGLALGFAPLAVDGLINSLGLVNTPSEFRFFTGLLAGAAAARALWPALLAMTEIIEREFIAKKPGPAAGRVGE